jgi:protein transport protein SEC20
MSLSLSQRLQSLADTYKSTLAQIAELRNFNSTTYSGDSADEHRLELATEIHESLREQEDTLEILKQELDDDVHVSRRHESTSRETERERNADMVIRLSEDIKSARAQFRKAQLQAKRTADAEKRKEREQLFADRKQDDGGGGGGGQSRRNRPATHEKLTQDEIAMRAAEDVTIALRRVHQQMEGELSVSQFAQQTLEESQQALESLAVSYAGTTDLLKASRGFVSQLVRSNKSDTWFLKTSFYLLAVTIAWLFFRRILYGPIMLFIWWPVKLMWWTTMTAFGMMGLGGKGEVSVSSLGRPSLTISMPGMNPAGIPTHAPGVQVKSMHLPNKGGGSGHMRRDVQQDEAEDSMIEKIARMMDDEEEGVETDNLSEEERLAQEDQPRNPKKRMMEVDVEPVRDEL